MIETVSQFLEEFKNKGLKHIIKQDSDINHPVTIGNMFEGLTSELLNRAIFKGLDLRIVQNSFIYNQRGNLSKEMDCMIVTGTGQRIAFTDQYKYPIKNVIAVVQVKKQLYKDSIDDAHQNLKSVIDTAEPRDGEAYMRKIQYDSYKGLVNKILPREEQLNSLPWREQNMYHYLLMQAFWPLRILIGYNSYKSEYSLRKKFVDHLEKVTSKGPARGYSPIGFPDLMICGDFSIIKNIGMPFVYPLNIRNEYYWNILLSGNEKPMLYLLEFIWTRLCYKFSLGSQIFGENSNYSLLHPFIMCKERKIDPENYGWEYKYHAINHKDLCAPLTSQEWQPIEIDTFQQAILHRLFEEGRIKCNDELDDYFHNFNLSLDVLIKDWTTNKIAYRVDNEIILLMDEPLIISTPDGKVYLGENKSGQMGRWIEQMMKKISR